jgi:Cd(II)/Pb(II)-responsive transcriptional regulator
MKKGLRIGELAERVGTQVETIRYYERAGLLPAPARSDGNYRVFDAGHVDRLSFIRHCRSLDMTLGEIRLLLEFRDAPDQDCSDVNALLDAHIGHVAERISELQRLEKQLKRLRRQCQRTRTAKDCGILHELAQPNGTSEASGHVPPTHSARAARPE